MKSHSKSFKSLKKAMEFYRWGERYADAIYDLKLHSNMSKTVYYVHWNVK